MHLSAFPAWGAWSEQPQPSPVISGESLEWFLVQRRREQRRVSPVSSQQLVSPEDISWVRSGRCSARCLCGSEKVSVCCHHVSEHRYYRWWRLEGPWSGSGRRSLLLPRVQNSVLQVVVVGGNGVAQCNASCCHRVAKTLYCRWTSRGVMPGAAFWRPVAAIGRQACQSLIDPTPRRSDWAPSPAASITLEACQTLLDRPPLICHRPPRSPMVEAPVNHA